MPQKSKQILRQTTLFGTKEGSSSPTKSPSPRKTRPSHINQSSEPSAGSGSDGERVSAIKFEPQVIEVDDSDEEDIVAKPVRPPRKRVRLNRVVSNLDHDSEGSIPPKSSRSRAIISDSDSDPQPTKRRLAKGVRPHTPDDVDLDDEVDVDRIIESRFRQRDKKSAFQMNLDKLKNRKKLGNKTIELSSSSEEDEEESKEEEEEDTPFADAKPDGDDDDDDINSRLPGSELDEDSFIVDDDADGIEAPELPAEFRSAEDITHHHKIICQLFVHVAVQAPEDRHAYMEDAIQQEYFSVPLANVRRKLSGLRDSLVASSVWRPNFKRPLEKYPEFELSQLDFAIPTCDACHLGGRMSTLVGRCSGRAYDPLGFLPTRSSKSEGSDSEASEDSEDSEEERPAEFHLGRFCAKRTLAYHRFTHWEYSLFAALLLEVDVLRKSKSNRHFVRVAHAKGVKPPEDLTDADAVVEWLDSRGIIEQEWHNIKQMMESARNLEMVSKRGDDVD